MKSFIIKVSIYVLVFAIITVGLCFLVDPFNVLHVEGIRDNGVEPNKNYIKMTYVLRNPEKFDSFVMGSSRVGNIHVEKIPQRSCYNMTYSEGLPAEHLANIKTLIESGIIPKSIYMGVDSHSYTLSPETHAGEALRCSYERLKKNPLDFLGFYFDPAMVISSPALKALLGGRVESFTEDDVFYKYGWNADYNEPTSYDFSHASPNIGGVMRLEETLAEIGEIVALCRSNGIELTVFTNPMYTVTHEIALERNYLVFLEGLAEITPYYNFSGYNAVTTDSSNYLDASHYTAEVGDLIIDCMCLQIQHEGLYEEGFGQYITQDNVDKLIELLSAQQAERN